MDINDFDTFLSENSSKPSYVYIHPLIWNGHWGKRIFPKWFRAFRIIGRLVKSRHIYWIGLPLYWVKGLKECV